MSAMDTAAGTLLSIQVNLIAGTLAKYARSNHSLRPLLQDVLQYKVMYATACLTLLFHV